MPLSRRLTAALLATVIGGLATACGESKVSQCNKLSAVVNKVAKEAQALSKANKPDDQFAQLSKAADSLDGYAAELQQVQLKDETLKGYQTRFVAIYTDTSKASRSLVDAFKKRDQKAGNAALNSLQEVASREDPLLKEVNTYCGAK
ncbi:MAG: hypothetical protein SFW36_24075 [Leptolyngbyaceae cyanobacterium bins.59]|nr:hypothetical protein [Leptolyngbyaceae cyanobacterium bins.59]